MAEQDYSIPTSTGIGQGTAQVFDFSPIAKAAAGYESTKIGIEKDKKDKYDIRGAEIGKYGAEIRKADKILPEHRDYFKVKAAKIQDTMREYQKSGDPALKGQLEAEMSSYITDAQASSIDLEAFQGDENFKRQTNPLEVYGGDKREAWRAEAAKNAREGKLIAGIPRLQKQEWEDMNEVAGKIADGITTDTETRHTGLVGGRFGAWESGKSVVDEGKAAVAALDLIGTPQRVDRMTALWQKQVEQNGGKAVKGSNGKEITNLPEFATNFIINAGKTKNTLSAVQFAPVADGGDDEDFFGQPFQNESINITYTGKKPAKGEAPTTPTTANVLFGRGHQLVKTTVTNFAGVIDLETGKPLSGSGEQEVVLGSLKAVPVYVKGARNTKDGELIEGRMVDKGDLERATRNGRVRYELGSTGVSKKNKGTRIVAGVEESVVEERPVFVKFSVVEGAYPKKAKKGITAYQQEVDRLNLQAKYKPQYTTPDGKKISIDDLINNYSPEQIDNYIKGGALK